MLITILFKAVQNKGKDDFYRRIESSAAIRPYKLYNWHSYICERFIYSHDRSAFSAAGKYAE